MTDTVNVLTMLLEGMSVRSCERLTGIHRDTIVGLVVEAGEACQRFMDLGHYPKSGTDRQLY